MRGEILAFDYRTGTGEISGDDGARYRFGVGEWQPLEQPQPGQQVHFDPARGEALAIRRRAGQSRPASEKNKIVAAILAIIFGWVGVHKFYLNQNGAGAIMLLGSLTGVVLLAIPTMIFGIIAFIEALIYLTMSDGEFHRRYVAGDRSWF